MESHHSPFLLVDSIVGQVTRGQGGDSGFFSSNTTLELLAPPSPPPHRSTLLTFSSPPLFRVLLLFEEDRDLHNSERESHSTKLERQQVISPPATPMDIVWPPFIVVEETVLNSMTSVPGSSAAVDDIDAFALDGNCDDDEYTARLEELCRIDRENGVRRRHPYAPRGLSKQAGTFDYADDDDATDVQSTKERKCSSYDCFDRHYAKGFCRRCYRSLRRTKYPNLYRSCRTLRCHGKRDSNQDGYCCSCFSARVNHLPVVPQPKRVGLKKKKKIPLSTATPNPA